MGKILGGQGVCVFGVPEAVAALAGRLDGEAHGTVRSVLDALHHSPATADLRNECSTRPQPFFQKAVDATLWRQLAAAETRPIHRERLVGVQRPRAGVAFSPTMVLC